MLVDIITGASAGGINGVFLAQAISTGQSLEPLTDLWLRDADIEALIEPGRAPSSRFTKAWAMPLAWMAARRGGGPDGVDETVEASARDEVRAKLSTFIRSRWFEPPFGGHRFTNMMLDALAAMAKEPCGGRLLPEGQPLDLFVTVTDFRGHPSGCACIPRPRWSRPNIGWWCRSATTASRACRWPIRPNWCSRRVRLRAFPAPFRRSWSANSTRCWRVAANAGPAATPSLSVCFPGSMPPIRPSRRC